MRAGAVPVSRCLPLLGEHTVRELPDLVRAQFAAIVVSGDHSWVVMMPQGDGRYVAVVSSLLFRAGDTCSISYTMSIS